jgi:hypothetical protein
MGLRSFFDDMDEMRRDLAELLAADTAEERAASRQIAESASGFSQRARAVVDDKLSFSATLMRAGEVSAAARLLAEVEETVRNEEVALIETVNEVKVAQAVRRGRITRLRLARSLAAAMLGACVLAFSAVGMAVAGVFQDRDERVAFADLGGKRSDPARKTRSDGTSRPPGRLVRKLQIGDVKLVLTQDEFRRLTALAGEDFDESALTDVLALLQGALAEKVEEAIAIANEAVDDVPEVVLDATPVGKKAERVKDKGDGQSEQPPQDHESPEPSPQPSDQEEKPEPEPEPQPSPSPSESDDTEHSEEPGAGPLLDEAPPA